MRYLLFSIPLGLALAQAPGGRQDPYWRTVGVGTLAARPSSCTSNRSVYICTGSDCPNYPTVTIYYCRAGSWVVTGDGGGSSTLQINDNSNNPVGNASILQFKTGTGMTWTLTDEGSGRISARPDVDTTGLVTLSGTQTVTSKTMPDLTFGTAPGYATVQIPNDTTTGTQLYRLAKLTGAPSKAIVASTGDKDGIVGVVIAGSGTTGNAQIVVSGQASCNFDGATTAGYFVIPSTTGAGYCNAVATRPTDGTQVLGIVTETASSPAGPRNVYWFGPGVSSSSQQQHVITFSLVGTGNSGWYPSVDYSCTIYKAMISGDVSGSMTVDIWKANAAIPTSANKISGTSPVTLSSAQLNQNSPITGWTTSVSPGDVFGAYVQTMSGVTKATVQIWCR